MCTLDMQNGLSHTNRLMPCLAGGQNQLGCRAVPVGQRSAGRPKDRSPRPDSHSLASTWDGVLQEAHLPRPGHHPVQRHPQARSWYPDHTPSSEDDAPRDHHQRCVQLYQTLRQRKCGLPLGVLLYPLLCLYNFQPLSKWQLPGVFWLPGMLSVKQIESGHPSCQIEVP